MRMIAAAYSSYTTWSLSQISTAAADAGTKGSTQRISRNRHRRRTPRSPRSASRTAPSSCWRGRRQNDPSSTGCRHSSMPLTPTVGGALGGSDAGGGLSVGMDLFKIISGAGDDSIRFTPATPRSMPARATMWLWSMARPTLSPARVTISSAPMAIRPWMAAPATITSSPTIIQRPPAVTHDYIRTYAYSNVSVVTQRHTFSLRPFHP